LIFDGKTLRNASFFAWLQIFAFCALAKYLSFLFFSRQIVKITNQTLIVTSPYYYTRFFRKGKQNDGKRAKKYFFSISAFDIF